MALDSVASFKARMHDLGIPQAHITSFEARNVKTFASFAFISPYQPSNPDEKPFTDALSSILGADPGDYLPTYRRLFYESHTMAIQDLRLSLIPGKGRSLGSWRCPKGWSALAGLRPH